MNVSKFFIAVFWLWIHFPAISQSYTSYMTGDSNDVVVNLNPGFLLAGGGTDNDDAMRWMLERARGGDVLILRATGSNGYNDYLFNELGIPVNSVESIVFKNKGASEDAYITRRINEAEIIFIAGGDQTVYFNYWANTSVARIINDAIQKQSKVIGGTSAGMMALGGIGYFPLNAGVTSDEALKNPYHPNINNINYDGIFQINAFKNIIFDTHFDNRNRAGRLCTLLARIAKDKNIRSKAIACNEGTWP
jgi:cyanophycinase-like exopeptidase